MLPHRDRGRGSARLALPTIQDHEYGGRGRGRGQGEQRDQPCAPPATGEDAQRDAVCMAPRLQPGMICRDGTARRSASLRVVRIDIGFLDLGELVAHRYSCA